MVRISRSDWLAEGPRAGRTTSRWRGRIKDTWLEAWAVHPLQIVIAHYQYFTLRDGQKSRMAVGGVTYWNGLSFFFFSCGDGAISSSSTFHACYKSEMSRMSIDYKRNSLVRCRMRLEERVISLGTVLIETAVPTQLYSWISYFSHACNALGIKECSRSKPGNGR